MLNNDKLKIIVTLSAMLPVVSDLFGHCLMSDEMLLLADRCW